ncbi:hypothetical protein CF335_g8530 [Tilletia laevis]|nr:hypothetical protein CF335_g8530 [Tilletia laevis]
MFLCAPTQAISNDWTAKYLEDIVGEEARRDADVRQHLGRYVPIAATKAPVSMQLLLASGSGTSGPAVGTPSYSLNNLDDPSAHKRVLGNNKAAIDQFLEMGVGPPCTTRCPRVKITVSSSLTDSISDSLFRAPPAR